MTFDEALAKAVADLDVVIEQARQRFEQSLIDHQCPPDDIEDFRAYEREYMAAWRTRTLATMRAQLLAPSATVH